jgi:hypothetical protein
MRIIRIAQEAGPSFAEGDIVDVRSSGNGDVTADIREDGRFRLRLPRGIYRCVVSKVEDPDFYEGNTITYVGRTDDGKFVKFTDKCRAMRADGPSRPSAIGAGRRRAQKEVGDQPQEWPFTIDKICAYCGKVMGMVGSNYQMPTHGICDVCFKNVMDDLDRTEKAQASV